MFVLYFDIPLFKGELNSYKKAQLTLSNPRDVKACKNRSNSTCFVLFHRIPFSRMPIIKFLVQIKLQVLST